MKIQSINPYTEKINAEFDQLTYDEAVKEVKNSDDAFIRWNKFDLDKRIDYIRKVAEVLRKNSRKYAETITKEMGKPIKDSIAEVEKCASLCDYYIENSKEFLKDEYIKTESKKSYITFEPLGKLLVIMPWNFPFWQVFRPVIPAIIAGNVTILKHASNVPMCALDIEEIFNEAGLPKNVFKTLLTDPKTAMRLIEDDYVDCVSLTGSNRAGSAVGSLAGKQIKKIVLELGGSDPFIVLDDADVKKAAEMGVKSRFINTGQSCIAAKRFIVMSSVYEEFKDEFIKNLKALKVGDPMDESTDIGPVAKKEFMIELNKQLADSIEKGGVKFSNDNVPKKGYFVSPTCVLGVSKDSRIITEEVFGPIAPIIEVKEEEKIIEIANNTEFGLGASIWSKDTDRAEKLAKRIQSGFVAINDFVKSDPRLPFGGTKKSGVGRELSIYGLKEFVNIKTINVKE